MSKSRNGALRLLTGTVLATAVLAVGCTSPKVSDSLYRSSEVGTSKRIVRCRVLEVREVLIRDDDSGESGEALGAVAGGLAGGIAGSAVGSGTGQGLATVGGATVGAVAGGAAGRQLSDQLNTRKGIEYSIILADGSEQTHVQDFLEGDRVVQVGETCRLQIEQDGKNRVLPAEQLQDQIRAPKQTKIVP
ncbi:MAG: glycine zipper 2TM domain-containing protein [Rhodospirillales bacterium]|nr:MAG: glycine zipper 2TM domain-containing protein [Rhodospirillales bacterium]